MKHYITKSKLIWLFKLYNITFVVLCYVLSGAMILFVVIVKLWGAKSTLQKETQTIWKLVTFQMRRLLEQAQCTLQKETQIMLTLDVFSIMDFIPAKDCSKWQQSTGTSVFKTCMNTFLFYGISEGLNLLSI